ncbi:hypothetical protein ROHU_001580 [Labeo rohita]|uniref:Uncharacterized protein n=1 Tax=Labeo rohita TaxID=84645 RepID=A0A498P172_LABRO|nr:hypothetical protein ROHU_006613 [Labeo rohita]RXN37921.1 hypothetical protein ROHU_001580 [Labeo rohita]
MKACSTCTHIKAALGDGGESPEGPSRPQLSAVRQTPGPGRAACCSFDPASSSCWFVQRDFVLAVLLSLCPAAQQQPIYHARNTSPLSLATSASSDNCGRFVLAPVKLTDI